MMKKLTALLPAMVLLIATVGPLEAKQTQANKSSKQCAQAKCQNAMQIEFDVSGGFVYTHKRAEIDTCALAKPQQKQVEELVRRSGIKKDSPIKKLNPRAADVHHYSLTVTEKKRKYTAEFDTTTLPDAYRPLVEYLEKSATDVPRPKA